MKSLYLSFAACFFALCAMAQAPQKINYQAVARDAQGNVLASQFISVRLSVRSGSLTGNISYQETDTATTNKFGLFTVALGGSTVTQGTFTGIAWAAAASFWK